MSIRRLPTRGNPGKSRITRGFSLPPPVGGLNARDALSNMPPQDALILENIFPNTTYGDLRQGMAEYANTGTGTPIDTVMQWSGPTNNMLLAATSDSIFDATNPGSTGAAIATGFANGRWNTTMFTTSGGSFLVLCNGADAVRNYNGSAFTTPAITGVSSATLNYVCSHKSRLWFVQNDSNDAWYLDTLSIAGAAVKFPLGGVFQQGGFLVAIESVSQDSGNGQDDYLCFFSNNGELAVYQGTDPSDADTWSLVGRFALAQPVIFRPTLKVGGDIALTTDEGVISVMKSLNMDKAALAKAAITGKIATLFNGFVKAYRANYGWQSISYPQGNWALFNIPVVENSHQIQLVMNTLTGAWCTFSGWNANCFALLGNNLYFGGNDGRVMLCDTGFTDDGAAILARYKGAFNYLGDRGTNKYPTIARPNYQSNGQPSISFGIDTDFGDLDPGSTLDVPSITEGWDVGLWNEAMWAGENNFITDWQTVGGVGYCISPRMNILVKGQSFRLNAIDLQAQIGGPL